VTSWNWAYLTDFACFKPTYLPEDNPADFSFFFDTSLRRVCYVAPERFLMSGETKSGDVTDEMDIFSLGCVIAELSLEGTPLFSLSQMFKFRKGEYDPIRLYVDKIEDNEIKVPTSYIYFLRQILTIVPGKAYDCFGSKRSIFR